MVIVGTKPLCPTCCDAAALPASMQVVELRAARDWLTREKEKLVARVTELEMCIRRIRDHECGRPPDMQSIYTLFTADAALNEPARAEFDTKCECSASGVCWTCLSEGKL